jgi:putative ABC transport system permease protein
MPGYYLQLGVRKLRHNPYLTALMVLTLALGIAASVSTLTILHLMSNNPIPHKSSRLLVPVFDIGTMDTYQPGEKPSDVQMTYKDAINLLADKAGSRRSALFGIAGAMESSRADLPAAIVHGAAVSLDYFSMFEVPFLYGSAWRAEDESQANNVMILSLRQSEKMFGKINPVGKQVRYLGQEFRIVAVRDTWLQLPRYTHLKNGNGGDFHGEEDLYIPIATATRLQLSNVGSTWCGQHSNPGYQGRLDSECTWLQFWYEIASEADRAPLHAHLQAYVAEQKKLGRMMRPVPARLYDVMEWMTLLNVVEGDSRLAVWLAFGFLALCLINTIGLLLAKFSVRAAEVGVRRALGASRLEIFKQFLSETVVIGLAGGVLGLPLSLLGIRLLAANSIGAASLPPMDWFTLGITFLIAMAGSILAGLLPTWRACQVAPALQLKSQ